MENLKGKTILITGASSGIGRATAVEAARRGARVVVSARRPDALEETVQQIAQASGEAIAVVADVTDERAVAALLGRIREHYGRLDGAVNAAGATFAFGPTHELSVADFRQWIDGYLTSAFICCKHELGLMRASGGGSIVNVGTFVGLSKCMPGAVGYAAAKTGLIGLTRTIAREYASEQVRANLLVVGGTETPMKREWVNTPEAEQAVFAMHALGRTAEPHEIAGAAAFLLSDAASFVTGSALSVEGGLSLV
jgi:NAD(P)-dependent dehydrogenase (short-subunit alcohol dehydrogenase family)